MKLDMLDDLKDDELRAAIGHAQGLLKQRDDARKAKALADASAALAAVGLTLKDLVHGKARAKGAKAPAYHAGRQYQNPGNKTLVWNGKGQKPNWLRQVEAQGGRALELGPEAANDNFPLPVKKTG